MMRALEMDHSLAKAKEMMLEIVRTPRSFGNFDTRRRDGVVPRRTKMVVGSWNSGNSAHY